jgi:hypothetical protein
MLLTQALYVPVHEAVYAAIIGAAPVVLIGYVVEHRLAMTHRRVRSLIGLWAVSATIISTFLSALMSLLLLITAVYGVYYPLGVILLFTVGIMGLTGLLLASVLEEHRRLSRSKTP